MFCNYLVIQYILEINGEIKQVKLPHKFFRKYGSIGRVGSFILSDITGTIRVVLWDDNCFHLKNGICVGIYLGISYFFDKINSKMIS